LAAQRRQIRRLSAKLSQARQEAREASQDARQVRADLETAHEHVGRLTNRLRAVDGDLLRAENEDLRAELALARSHAVGAPREELLRERETNARLAARLAELEAGHITV
jgi:chromosome segregation ATPase